MATYTVVRQEEIRLTFDLEESDVSITGAEQTYGHLRLASKQGQITSGPPALILSSQFETVSAPLVGRWNFFGDSKKLQPGSYVGDLWIILAGKKVLLTKFNLTVEPNVTEIP